MTVAVNREDLFKRLREPFPDNQVGKLPKPYKKDSPKGKCGECGGYHGLPAVHLDYVGHAALTDRLLEVDPEWTWTPMALDEHGAPKLDQHGGMWINLTVLGVTRPGYGDAQGKSGGNAVKEAIGDALRNAGMRFGLALDLWHKGDLHEQEEGRGAPPDERELARQELIELAREKGWGMADVAARYESDNDHKLRDATVDEFKAYTAMLRSGAVTVGG
ncbi:hypothetical protein [Mycobacteroides abscessus]|uniref:hypothetical protein n=1 Tax=Mycobacteroides abscessus TaxID=36809 RepID=UPI0003722D63|nr:hypothetical protein [Mycobacteroides abscessus]